MGETGRSRERVYHKQNILHEKMFSIKEKNKRKPGGGGAYH